MSLSHGILGFLSYEPMTGYDLAKFFSSSVNFFWHAQTSQIYLELGKLEKNGMVSSEQILQTEKPNKKLYSLTPAGKEELQRWLKENKDTPDAFKDYKSAFLMQIFFSGDTSETETMERLQKFSSQCQEIFQQLDGIANQLQSTPEKDPVSARRAACWALTADFGKRYMEMCTQWAQDGIRTLRQLQETPGPDQT